LLNEEEKKEYEKEEEHRGPE